jgi:SAM-dependent methyltransferase
MGHVGDAVCLDVAAPNPVISHHLRRRGGHWCTVVADDAAMEGARLLLEEGVYAFGTDGGLPFPDKTFDVVVVFECLQRVRDDNALVSEFHRVLKSDGRLVLMVPHAKSWTCLKPLGALLGLTTQKRGWVRDGYSDSDLFRVLKTGFDVHHVRSFGRFFVEWVDLVARRVSGGLAPGSGVSYGMGLVYKVAFQLDALLFLTRGYHLVATAKRRAWRSREAPVLSDGRSISEAVLSRPLD